MSKKIIFFWILGFSALLVLLHLWLISNPIVTKYFTLTVHPPFYMDGPYIYGQYQISPYTNQTWWGMYGGTNRCWGIYLHNHWPIMSKEWVTTTVDSNGIWHTP